MNETVLALMGALAIYGLSSLAFSRSDGGSRDDFYDLHATDAAETASATKPEDESPLEG